MRQEHPRAAEVRKLQTQIRTETRRLVRANLKFRLEGLIKELAAQDYAAKVKRLSGNV